MNATPPPGFALPPMVSPPVPALDGVLSKEAATMADSTVAKPGMAVARPGTPADPEKLWQTAREFEAMALGEFLKPMFQTTESTSKLFNGGDAEKTWKPMLVDEIAKQISAAGGLGLAASIHEAMLKIQEGKS